MLRFGIPLLGAVTLVLGCGDDGGDPAAECLPGESRACVGPGGCSGRQVCQPDGVSLGECVCGDDPDGGPTSDAGPSDGGPVRDGAVDDGFVPDAPASTTHTFPARDFTCTAGTVPVCETTVPARTDEERTRTIEETLDSETLTFVLTEIILADELRRAGFNLDGLNSGVVGSGSTCEEARMDHLTGSEGTGHPGTDNRYLGLTTVMDDFYDSADCPDGETNGCFPALVDDEIHSGSLLVLVELTDVDSLEHDPSVTVGIYLAAVAGGGPPSLSDGELAPDQTFETISTIAEPVTGDIFERRFRARFDRWDFPQRIADALVLLGDDLSDVEIRASFDSAGNLRSGNLGGHTPVDTFVGTAVRVYGSGVEENVRTFAEALADITPSSEPSICEDLSAGYRFSGVRANRTP